MTTGGVRWRRSVKQRLKRDVLLIQIGHCENSTALGNLLKDTQSIFWETNEHGNIPIMEIMSSQNRWLFLFQPFDPAKAATVDHMRSLRWCVLGLSKVRQEMNYGLVMEVVKAAGGYVVRLRHDNRIYAKRRSR
ncbi:hypothetical protein FB451DRAFT_1251614 [Mycena latifolia]|nr:hypothetical protein FB451DRAFT_1251614 [Mycena latifolia]